MLNSILIVLALVALAIAAVVALRPAARAAAAHQHSLTARPGQVLGFRPARKHERPGLYPVFAIAGGAPTVLEELRTRRSKIADEITELLKAHIPEDRDAAKTANDAIEARQGDLALVDKRIAGLTQDEERRQADAAAAKGAGEAGQRKQGGATVTDEPQVYGRGSGNSYFRDLAGATLGGDADAASRLNRHAQELSVELPKREARREQRRRDAEETRNAYELGPAYRGNGFEPEYRTNPNRTDGQGGYYIPPLWLIDQAIPLLRAGRVTADLCSHFDLPAGTDSINLPKIVQGSLTGTQLDNGAVPSRDITDTSVSAPVRTVAGQEDVAMQLLDQSPPPGFDEIVFQDLIGDYNMQLDLQVIAGTGSSGQLKGLTVMAGSNAVTYTDASPTVPELYLPLAQSLSQVARQRLRPATAIVAAIQRAYWLLSALDSNNRPLVTPVGAPGGSFNSMGQVNPGVAEGLLANVIGTNVYGDGNVPTNLGGGTNQDEIIAGKFDDAYLWEGELRTRVLQEVLSGTLQVRFQLYNYVAFMPDRYPTSFSIIGGTGLVAPAGF